MTLRAGVCVCVWLALGKKRKSVRERSSEKVMGNYYTFYRARARGRPISFSTKPAYDSSAQPETTPTTVDVAENS